MNYKIIFAYLISIIFLTTCAYGFGIATPYAIGMPLKVYPGQTTEFDIILNNQGNPTEVSAKGDLVDGSGIATIVEPKEIYTAAPYEPYRIKIRVVIPENTPVGTNYTIMPSFQQVSSPSDKSGMISMGVGIIRYMPVMVLTKDEVLGIQPPPTPEIPPIKEKSPLGLIMGIVILLVLTLGYVMWRKNKKTTEMAPQTTQENLNTQATSTTKTQPQVNQTPKK